MFNMFINTYLHASFIVQLLIIFGYLMYTFDMNGLHGQNYLIKFRTLDWFEIFSYRKIFVIPALNYSLGISFMVVCKRLIRQNCQISIFLILTRHHITFTPAWEQVLFCIDPYKAVQWNDMIDLSVSFTLSSCCKINWKKDL